MKSISSWNRRDFIVKPLSGLAASRLFGAVDLFARPAASAEPEIIHRTLGKTGIEMPIVSMGVMNASIPGVVRRAYERGMRHFDTAAGYQQGRNEEMLGSVIKELKVRDKVVIATKIFIYPPRRYAASCKQEMRDIFESSLKRLQMDHVDILYYHSVDNAQEAVLEGPLAVLSALKKEGLTRFVGISTHAPTEVLNEIAKSRAYDVALVPINYTMAHDKALLDAIDAAAKKGIGLVAMKTQAGGTIKPDPKLPQSLPPESQTALLKWVLRNENITTAIPGFTNFEQLDQNFSVALNLTYTKAEESFLADKNFSAAAEFCVQCGQCRPDCPYQVAIPTLMRSHMYAVQYSNKQLAQETLRTLAGGRGLDACSSCSSCKAACRNTVNIARKITELKAITA
jgi:predicted aldo/keto reductase-like oxidoreductase